MTRAPLEMPDGVMLFDGVCNLCNGSVRALIRIDREGVVRFAPLQTPYGQKLAALCGVDSVSPESFVFFDKGDALRKTAAVAAILRRMRAPWRWLAIIDRLPPDLTDRIYDGVARNRYRLFGRRAHCVVPRQRHADRFITEDPLEQRR